MEIFCKILIEFGIPIKLVKIMKTCLNETYSSVRAGKHLFDMFPIKNGLKQGDALSVLPFNSASEYAIRRVQVKQDGWKFNCTHQLLVYADDVNRMGRRVHVTVEPLLSGLMTGCRWPDNKKSRIIENDLLMPPNVYFKII
jgi:hypothetical protein